MISINNENSMEMRVKQRVEKVLEGILDEIVDEFIIDIIKRKMEGSERKLKGMIKEELEKYT